MTCRYQLASAVLFLLVAACPVSLALSPSGRVDRIACAPTDESVAAAISEGWIWITRDGGATWRRGWRLEDDLEGLESDEVAEALPLERGVIPGREEGELFTSGLWEEDLDIGADEHGQADEPGRTGVALDVSDDNRWMVSIGGEILSGRGGGGAPEVRHLEGVFDVLFDGGGNGWAVGLDRVYMYARGGVTRNWIAPGAGRLARGSHPGQVLLPCRDGLRVFDSSGESGVSVSVFDFGQLEAVAALSNGRGWVLAARGRLWVAGPEGKIDERAGFPFAVAQMVVDGRDVVHARDETGRWSKIEGGEIALSSHTAAAVDSAGRLWAGTESGPVIDELAGYSFEGRNPGVQFGRETLFGPIRIPPEPPCPPKIVNPVPSVRVVARFGRGDGTGYGFPAADHLEWARTWFFAGVNLAWDLSLPDPVSCIEARRSWIGRVSDRRIRVMRLRTGLGRAAARVTGEGALERFIANNEAAEARQLLEIAGGQDAAAKEE